jgi:hypothetical protein
LVEQHKMSQATADREIAVMKEIAADMREQVEAERAGQVVPPRAGDHAPPKALVQGRGDRVAAGSARPGFRAVAERPAAGGEDGKARQAGPIFFYAPQHLAAQISPRLARTKIRKSILLILLYFYRLT